MMQEWQKNILALSILPQIILVKLLAQFPQFIENVYSTGIYQLIAKIWRYVLGWIPFSFGDIFYTFLGIYAIRWLVIHRKRLLKNPLTWFRDVLIAISMAYAAFHLFWAFNYYRLPLHKKMDIGNDYTTEELIQVIDQLIVDANAAHTKIVANDSLMATTDYSKDELLQNSIIGFDQIEKEYPFLALKSVSIKSSLYRWPLTYMGFGGYLNPFSLEAQVNTVNLPHKMPTTASHEMGHQVGYAAENEANFIAFLTTTNHTDDYFKFSGYIFGLKHCLRELTRRAPETFDEKVETINIGIRKHYQAEYEFWQQYQNPLEPVFKASYNQFLKANNQSKGIESYSYVVALIVNYL